ncbi:MAG: DUF4375 domain-containing protein [Isosphaeraceae bacterium]
MSRTDYRVILRRFEFERLLVPPPLRPVTFGGRYSGRLLDAFSATDATELHRTFGQLNEAQQTLYALNSFCGEISNGGISQFLFNAHPLIRDAAATALQRIGATEALREYSRIRGRSQDERLAEIRATATSWDEYLAFKEGLGDEEPTHRSFDDWFFAGQEEILDRLTREYLAGRENDLVRFCEGDHRLEARWAGERLGRLVSDFDRYQVGYASAGLFRFFDLLFTPDRREQFGHSRDQREETARIVATGLMPLIRQAAQRPEIASYAERPSHRITIGPESAPPGCGRVTVSFHENELDLMWSISEWG